MPRGGARPGAGRKPGAAARKTREAADLLAAEGLTPLEYMVGLMRGTQEFDEVKFEAAKAAAPYIHPRLAATQVTASITRSHEDMLDELSREGEEIVSGLAH